MSDFIKKVAKIQRELKAPKNQYNSFGKYKYRSCEDILEGLKAHLEGLVLTLSDDVVIFGDRVYVKATATITNGTDSITNTGLARESLEKKGMDCSQITGTASSYARKYALNGLFCIDDTKDADTMDNIKSAASTAKQTEPDEIAKQWVAAIKADPKVIEQITDGKYKIYIQSLIK